MYLRTTCISGVLFCIHSFVVNTYSIHLDDHCSSNYSSYNVNEPWFMIDLIESDTILGCYVKHHDYIFWQ